jgi:hypothetical protein
MYGEALKGVIRDGKDFTDGREISKQLWNRTFDSKITSWSFQKQILICTQNSKLITAFYIFQKSLYW